MKKAGIFNPYWDTLGGGEKYTAAVVKWLLSNGYDVTIYWSDPRLPEKIFQRFGISLQGVHIDPSGYRRFSNLDLLFWVSDGSIPMPMAKKSFLHFQVPFHHVNKNKLTNFLKTRLFTSIVCNSKFTKKIIDREFGINSQVLYPPATLFVPLSKTNTILSVGRFSQLLHAKRQDILIKAFQEMDLDGWQLVLAGGSISDADTDNLKKLIQKDSVRLISNPSYQELAALYGQARIYWHAAGFQVNETTNPENVEHFGIATVEAMSAAAAPVVYAAGGQKEIIKDGTNGLLWTSVEELKLKTHQLIKDQVLCQRLSTQAQKDSINFDEKHFAYELGKIIG